MLDFRDLLDGVDVTKKHPSDEDVGGDANDQTEREFWDFLLFFPVFGSAFLGNDGDGRDGRDGCALTHENANATPTIKKTQERSESSFRDEPIRDARRRMNEKRKARKVVSLHGDLPQSARDAAVASLRAGACDVLVATDVAARGLDLPGVELVVHADPPKDADAYAHRAGRAGRPGCAAPGVSLLIAEPGAAAAAAAASLERRAVIRLRRLSAIGEKPAVEKSVAAARAAWEETQRQRRLVTGEGSARVPPANAGDDDDDETAGDAGDAKKGVAPDEASFARLGERALMDDRFDEFSVDLTRIRGKQKGAGAGRNEGKRRGKR